MDDDVTLGPDGFELAAPVDLPDVLDMLIVGGGPAGTAAAFRAKELGLTALVIEIDDVMKRIRDYDAAKPIKPDFGAGRQMGFPKAGELIEQLHFFTDVKSRELCRSWKQLYRDHGVPAHVFRLAGIYGPGRSPLDQVRSGHARRLIKPDLVLGRIHLDDIVGGLETTTLFLEANAQSLAFLV